MKLRVGIAGYGVVGKRRRLCVDSHPNMHTVAVCDQIFHSFTTHEDGLRCYPNYKDLLTEKLDVLFVCLPNYIASEVTIAGLQHGLHVFCEKPPGRDVADIAAVIETQKLLPRLKLKYGFNHRYHESVQDALKLIDTGEMGRIVNLRGVYGKSQFVSFGQNSDWRIKREFSGGGILLDQGIHMLDLMRLFVGEFDEIHSFVSNNFWKHDVEDNAYALMKAKSGAVAMLHSTATQWRHRFDLDICLERGSINLGGILSSSKSYGSETMTVAWAERDGVGDPREQRTLYNSDPSWQAEIDEFASCVLNNSDVIHGTSHDALQSMELVYRIYCADPGWKRKWHLSATHSHESIKQAANSN